MNRIFLLNFILASAAITPGDLCTTPKLGCVPQPPNASAIWQHGESNMTNCCEICLSVIGCRSWTWWNESAGGKLKGTCYLHPQNTGKLESGNCYSGNLRQAPPAPSPTPAPKGAKNVLLIIVDDLRPDATIFNQSFMITPNMDRLGKQGMVFNRAYCQQAICGPTRNSFLSGRRPQRTQSWNFRDNFRLVGPDWISLPQYFKINSYTTLGTGKTFHPNLPPAFDQPLSWSDEEPYYFPGSAYPACKEWPNSYACPNDDNLTTFTDWLSMNRTRSQIKKYAHQKKPFFLVWGAHRPHLPWNMPRRFWDLYNSTDDIHLPKHQVAPEGMPPIAFTYECDGKTEVTALTQTAPIPYPSAKTALPDNMTRTLRRGYYASVSWMDYLIGELLDTLDSTGTTNNTVVALIGDHGWQLGEHNIWGKHTNFELGTRVPLIISVPGMARGVSNVIVESIDLYPTLAAVAGLPKPPDVDGVDLTPLLINSNIDSSTLHFKEAIAFSEYPRCPHNLSTPWDKLDSCVSTPRLGFHVMGYSVRTEMWRYTVWLLWDSQNLQGDFTQPPVGEELYSHHEDNESDMDAFENVNLIDDPTYAPVKQQLYTLAKSQWDTHPPPPTNCTATQFENGTDYGGKDIGLGPATTAEQCCRLCGSHPGCYYFTFTSSTSKCRFKSIISGRKNNSDCTSGSRGNVPTNCTTSRFEIGTDYEGRNVGSLRGSSAEECCRICGSHPDCNYFSFKRSNAHCYFKNTVSGRKSDPDIISGSRGNVSSISWQFDLYQEVELVVDNPQLDYRLQNEIWERIPAEFD